MNSATTRRRNSSRSRQQRHVDTSTASESNASTCHNSSRTAGFKLGSTNNQSSVDEDNSKSMACCQYHRNRHRIDAFVHRSTPTSAFRTQLTMPRLSVLLPLCAFLLLATLPSQLVSASSDTPPSPSLSINFPSNELPSPSRQVRAADETAPTTSSPSAPESRSADTDQIVINQLPGSQPRDSHGNPLKGNPNYNYYVTSNNKGIEKGHGHPERYQVAKFDFEHGKWS